MKDSQNLTLRLLEFVVSTLPEAEQAKFAMAREALRKMEAMDPNPVGLAIIAVSMEITARKRAELFPAVPPPKI